ncbi:MAG: hypothetical protein ACI9FG_000214 [Crocinitomicaceae bacterium]|jgi:hypothetical protein
MKIPSQRAARMIASVRIGPAAPGLRPVASVALNPTRPMPSAAPSAASAIAIDPVIMVYWLVCLLLFSGTPHGRNAMSLIPEIV